MWIKQIFSLPRTCKVSHNSRCMQPDDHSTEPYGINIERLLVHTKITKLLSCLWTIYLDWIIKESTCYTNKLLVLLLLKNNTPLTPLHCTWHNVSNGASQHIIREKTTLPIVSILNHRFESFIKHILQYWPLLPASSTWLRLIWYFCCCWLALRAVHL